MDKAYVYWIHLKDHEDPYKEGYIGFTSTDVEERFKRHVKSSKHGSEYVIHKAIRKYGPEELIIDTLFTGSVEEAYKVEAKYRPEIWTGWNISAGGKGGNSPFIRDLWQSEDFADKADKIRRTQKTRLTRLWQDPDYRKKMSQLSSDGWADPEKKKKRSEKISKMCKDRYEENGPWDNPTTDKSVWSSAQKILSIWRESNQPGPYKLSQHVGVKETSLRVMVKMFREGWIPCEDVRWLDYFEVEYE